MSGVVGIWQRDGRPVERQLVEQFSGLLQHRGGDGKGIWVSGPFGLACQNFWVTPESLDEIQPVVHPSGAVAVFDGRLDNREDLLSIAGGHDSPPSDACLILEAYTNRGASLLERLLGDFALALFDPARQRLFLVRDSLGVRPLYYCEMGSTLLFASEIKPLLGHSEVATTPNDDHLADFLFDRLHDPELTFFRGISNLPPAHLLEVSLDECRLRRYWDFDPSRRVTLGSFEAYAEAFREVFIRSVKRRLRSAYPVAVSASGGVDSSSILCVAEQLRRAEQGGPGLCAISYLSAEGSPSDEQHYLADIEQLYGTPIIRIPPGPMNLLDGSRQAVHCIEAPFVDEQWGNSERTLLETRRQGARVLLTGHWGDQMMYSQAYLIDLVRRLRWGTVLAHLREFSRWMTDVDPRWFYYRFAVDLVMEHLPAGIEPVVRRLRRGRSAPWFSAEFLRRARRRIGHRPSRPSRSGRFPSAYAGSLYGSARSGYYVFCMEWDNKLAGAFGLEMAFPFLDRDLIQFMMGVPGEWHARHGVPKALLRESMRGIVPEPILGRKWKADFTHLVNDGMDQEYAKLIDCLESGGRAAAMGYLDGRRLREALAPLKAELRRPDCLATWQLSDVLGLELWLQAFFNADGTTRPPAESAAVGRPGTV